MKKAILEALKAKFQGVSDNILDRIATKMAKTVTDEEQVKEAVENYTLQQVIDSYADSRANEAQQTAVKNYETKYGLKDGDKVDVEQQPQPPKDGGMPEWAQKLYATIQKQGEELTAFKQGSITTSRKKQLTDITSRLPESMRKGYDRIAVDGYTDEEFTNLLTEITTEADNILTETKQTGVVFGGRSNGNHNGGSGDTLKATDKEVDEVAAKLSI
jgi:hypothetical protein